MASINRDECTGCENCLPYCPVGAISIREEKAFIEPKLCTECYVCIRNDVCPCGAIERPSLETFIDQFRHLLSDPTETTAKTGVPGRGTEEAKTNDVTGRFKMGEVGICIDMGRPGVGVNLRDVEKVAMAVAAAGATLGGPDETPLAQLMTNLKTGKIHDELPDVRFLSIIIEAKCPVSILSSVLESLKKVENEISTVFSLGLATRVDKDGHSPVLDILEGSGLNPPIRGKVNVGLGRPLMD